MKEAKEQLKKLKDDLKVKKERKEAAFWKIDKAQTDIERLWNDLQITQQNILFFKNQLSIVNRYK